VLHLVDNSIKKLNDFFKCIYFFTIESPFRSITLPHTSGTRVSYHEENIFVGNLFLLMCPSQCWSEHCFL